MSKDIINIISEITFCLLDVVLLYRFSLLSLKIKAHHNFIILLISLLTAFTAFGMSFISTYSWVSTLILLGSIIVYVLIVFQGQTKAKIVTALLYYLILGVLTMLVSSLAFVVFSITTNQLLENIGIRIGVALVIKIVYLIIIEAVRKKQKNTSSSLFFATRSVQYFFWLSFVSLFI